MSFGVRLMPIRWATRTKVEVRGLAVSHGRLLGLAQNRASREPANELQPGLGHTIKPALVGNDGGDDVSISTGDEAAAVDVWQQVLVVGHPRPAP
jgi:hypothetical protein